MAEQSLASIRAKHPDSQMISYKGIEHGIVTDAPFVGSRICAMTCHHGCPGCINHELLEAPYKVENVYEIIFEVKSNKISQGIILGGLEWTEQPYEMIWLIDIALDSGLEVMLYTHHDIEYMLEHYPAFKGKKMYIKCGEYLKDRRAYMDEVNDVFLAGDNQKIYNMSTY